MNLQEKAEQIHNLNHKWWVDLDTGLPIKRDKRELRMLIISELAEAMEGERKHLQDDKLPHRKMAEVEMADALIRILDYAAGFGVEVLKGDEILNGQIPNIILPENKGAFLYSIAKGITMGSLDELDEVIMVAGSIWSIEKYCQKFGYDLWGAVDEKLEYNKTRIDHTHEARKAANGKKF